MANLTLQQAKSSALLLSLALFSSIAARGQNSISIPTYYEFGSVVSLGQRSIDIQTFDQQKQRLVQHSFVLSRDTRADIVHIGDTVEVIFTPGNDWTVRRLVLLTAGIPKEGPPTVGGREVPAPTSAHLGQSAPAARVPSATTPALSGNAKSSANAASARNVTLAGNTAPAKITPTAASVDLGNSTKPKAAPVIDVPLGESEAALPKTPKTKEVSFEVPLAECNRSSTDWPTQPLRLAVLDFRYPTEREESHDIGTTGGGSGTAVADLVFARLDSLNEFAMSRGDRTRLYRADFAGAARVGRELGVDAVLAGTFQPLDPPPGSDPDFPPPKSYELRAGIVDTCTGQLLERLVSVQCPPGLDPNAALNAPSCKVLSVTAKQATDPKEAVHAFRSPIDALLNPLEHNGPPPGTQGSAGIVTAADSASVTIKLPAGVQLKSGDQVAVHAWRLTKNPTTYTLHNLHDEEIGRVTLSRVQGGQATGTFAGDFPPHPGDTAELITQ
jgi:hypothetical protein